MFVFKNKEEKNLSPDSLSGFIQKIFKYHDYANSNFKISISEVKYEIIRDTKKSNGDSSIKGKYKLNMPTDVYASNTVSPHHVKIIYSLSNHDNSIVNAIFSREFYYHLLYKENLSELVSSDSFIDTGKLPLENIL